MKLTSTPNSITINVDENDQTKNLFINKVGSVGINSTTPGYHKDGEFTLESADGSAVIVTATRRPNLLGADTIGAWIGYNLSNDVGHTETARIIFGHDGLTPGQVGAQMGFMVKDNGSPTLRTWLKLRRNGQWEYSAGALIVGNGLNWQSDPLIGTKFATSPTQKISFWGATPKVQGAAIANPSGGSCIDTEARSAINALLDRLRSCGLIAS